VARLPIPGGDQGVWGDVLNDFLSQSLDEGGLLKDSAITSTQIAPGAIVDSNISSSAGITRTKLDGSVQTSLNRADSALQTAPVTSVVGRIGDVILTSTDVGLANVSNTSDANKPISTATQTALNLKVASSSLSTVATSGLYSDLTSKPTLAPVATSGLYSDLTSKPTLSTVATSGSYADLTNKPTIPTVPVTSVAGRTGDVILTSSDVGLANVNNTADSAKPVSTAQQTALNLKVNTSSLATVATSVSYTDLSNKPTIPTVPVTSVSTRTGDIVLTSADVGLGNVDNTSDISKNSATATLTNKTISGSSNTISGIAESSVTNLTTDLSTLTTNVATKATDSAVVHNTGNETIAGTKTFSGSTIMTGVAASDGGTALAPVAGANNGNYYSITPSSTAPIFQAAGSSSSINTTIRSKGAGTVILQPGSDSVTAVTLATASGSPVVSADTTDLTVGVGKYASSAAVLSVAGSSTTKSSINFAPGALPTAIHIGDLINHQDRGALVYSANGSTNSTFAFVQSVYTYSGNSSIGLTTTETTLLNTTSNFTGTMTVDLYTPASFNVPMTKLIRVQLKGAITTSATPGNLTIAAKVTDPAALNTRTISVVVSALPASVTSKGFAIELFMGLNIYNDNNNGTTVTYIGTSGEISHYLTSSTRAFYDVASSATFNGMSLNGTQLNFDITAHWSLNTGGTLYPMNIAVDFLQ
jgi:hypothetical protein